MFGGKIYYYNYKIYNLIVFLDDTVQVSSKTGLSNDYKGFFRSLMVKFSIIFRKLSFFDGTLSNAHSYLNNMNRKKIL